MLKSYLVLLNIILISQIHSFAQNTNTPIQKLLIGVKESPPFVVKNPDGSWNGISIWLWKQIADDLDIEFEFREMELEELLQSVSTGEIDAVVGSLTITPERELKMDFTHSFYSSGLGVAVSSDSRSKMFLVIQRFFSVEFVSVLATLIFLLLSVGWLVWYFERKNNPDQFGGKQYEGVLSGFWWSAVTMTTVGYGDKSPVTTGGRIVALIWMFTSIIIISGITASITTALTVTQLESSINSVNDLSSVRIATVSGSAAEEYLRNNGMRVFGYESLDDALIALDSNRVEAAVYDAPILRFLIMNNPNYNVQILPFTFQRQDYGFALKSNSKLREPINISLLNISMSDEWKQYIEKQLGEIANF